MMNIKLPYRVPVDLSTELLDLANKKEHHFKEHGLTTYNKSIHKFLKLDDLNDELFEKVSKFGSSLFDDMNMKNRTKENYMGYSLLVVKNHGFVHNHIDGRDKNNFLHVRINFLLSKSDIGGDPIIDNVKYVIEEGESWINLASIWKHGCTEVKGNKPRVTLSLGHYVEPKEVKNFLSTFLIANR
jgi:hypothetical protein